MVTRPAVLGQLVGVTDTTRNTYADSFPHKTLPEQIRNDHPSSRSRRGRNSEARLDGPEAVRNKGG
jgi:hypothetical protein